MWNAKKGNRNRKTDRTWELIFDELSVLDKIDKHGILKITSKEINEYNGPDARIMTKFDYWDNLPYIFQKNKLNILPISRGEYIISHFNAYHRLDIDSNVEPCKIDFPHWIKTLDYNNLSSEAKVLNCAYITGILDRVIEEGIKPTIDGRMSTRSWDFNIDNTITSGKIQIFNNKSQCQIDGGYEGLNKFAIIEAKNSLSKDFIVRQLYYPYRLWKKNLGTKKIIPIFLVYSNGIFHFLIYKFNKLNEYNSIELIDHKSYKITEKGIEISDIVELIKKTEIIQEPKVPFPQADSFERVIDLLNALNKEELNNEEISLMYDFDYRQAQYYSRACMYLDLAQNINGTIKLTEEALKILRKGKREKYLSIASKILEHKVFKEALKLYIKSSKPPKSKEIYKEVMDKNKETLYKQGSGFLSKRTLVRRASTVKGWIDWVLGLQKTV